MEIVPMLVLAAVLVAREFTRAYFGEPEAPRRRLWRWAIGGLTVIVAVVTVTRVLSLLGI